MIRNLSFIMFLICISSSCTEDRVEVLDKLPSGDTTTEGVRIVEGLLMVNEFVAYQHGELNEFGDTSTWAEFYNTTNTTVLLEEGKWFVTDKLWENPDRYRLPEVSIPPFGYLLVWCDNRDTVANDIHTNFSLNRNGEAVGIYYLKNDGELIEIDAYEFGPQNEGYSKGRYPDGSPNWIEFDTPTPGAPNEF